MESPDPKVTQARRGYQVYQVSRERMELRDKRVTLDYRGPGDLTVLLVRAYLEQRETEGTGEPEDHLAQLVLWGRWGRRVNQESLGRQVYLDYQGGVSLVPRENQASEVHLELWESRG